MNSIRLPKEEAVELITGYKWDGSEYEPVSKERTGETRWEAHFMSVIKRKSDGSLWGHNWSRGLTETQDHRSWDDSEELIFAEVEKKVEMVEVITYKYVMEDE